MVTQNTSVRANTALTLHPAINYYPMAMGNQQSTNATISVQPLTVEEILPRGVHFSSKQIRKVKKEISEACPVERPDKITGRPGKWSPSGMLRLFEGMEQSIRERADAEIDIALDSIDSIESVQVFNKYCKALNLASSAHEGSCRAKFATCAFYDYAKQKNAEKESKEKGRSRKRQFNER